jgi:ubiquitin carboxyl-terminal hydrolase L3
MEYEKHFIPLESDPQVFTSLMHNLGVTDSLEFIDIWSLEAEQLNNIRLEIQSPIEALILILPDCPADAEQTIKNSVCEGDILWLKQTINNACGLYAILHCVCNILGTKEIGRIFYFSSMY